MTSGRNLILCKAPRWVVRGAALTVIALAVGTGSARADVEINLGTLTPNGGLGGCSNPSSGDFVCANSLSFTSNGHTFTATGYANIIGGVATTPTALTFREVPPNGADEGGLGENASPPPVASCSDSPDCEIAGTAAVLIHDTNLIDAIIGSAQSGEGWAVWAGTSPSTLTEVASGTGSCASPIGGATCLVSFASEPYVAVQHTGTTTGDVLFTSLSIPSVPEPASLALLGTALAGLGLMRRRRRA